MGGPEVLGEGPLFAPLNAPLWVYYNKIKMLDRYVRLNQHIAEKLGIQYMNIRQAFLDALPAGRKVYSGCLTTDGNHENNNGAVIVAKIFAEVLYNWLESK
jgi:lysophospholipase L1-like esterase